MYTYRETKWVPEFRWVKTIEECADVINSWHEDYPARVEDTIHVLRDLLTTFQSIKKGNKQFPKSDTSIPVTNWLLQAIQGYIFHDESHRGQFRKVNVVVGNHRPPDYSLVEKAMEELALTAQNIDNLDDLYQWYWDFETIHPFRDGNGRTGGVIVAVFSHLIEPEKGFLAPLQ